MKATNSSCFGSSRRSMIKVIEVGEGSEKSVAHIKNLFSNQIDCCY